MELARSVFGCAQAKNAGLDQPADIAQCTATPEPAGATTGGVKPCNCRAVPPLYSAVPVNSGHRPAFLFSFNDAPVMKALSLYRQETRS